MNGQTLVFGSFSFCTPLLFSLIATERKSTFTYRHIFDAMCFYELYLQIIFPIFRDISFHGDTKSCSYIAYKMSACSIRGKSFEKGTLLFDMTEQHSELTCYIICRVEQRSFGIVQCLQNWYQGLHFLSNITLFHVLPAKKPTMCWWIRTTSSFLPLALRSIFPPLWPDETLEWAQRFRCTRSCGAPRDRGRETLWTTNVAKVLQVQEPLS